MKYIKTTLLALMFSTSILADCSYELFSISSVKDTKIIDFVDQLSDECGFSIIVTDPYAEKFLSTHLNKTNLKNLTIDEVLDIILLENNLSYTLENNLLKISYLTTKVFEIDYILSQRKSTGSTDVTLSSNSASSQGAVTGASGRSGTNSTNGQSNSQTGIKIESTDEVKFWEELDLEFQSILNRPHDSYKSGAPIINKNAGLITVTSTAKQMKRFESYIQKLQDKVQLQVLIDVQLLSVTMNEGKTTGIDWQQLYALQNFNISLNHISNKNVDTFDDTGATTTAIAANAIDGIASIVNIKAQASLTEVIKFLKTQGNVNSISNPKVLTLNNQPALITAGTEYFYKIESQTNQQGTGGGVAATTQNQNIQSVFAGVLLTITPEISDDSTITLKINPSLSETTVDISSEDNSKRDMPPDLNRRQLSSVVTVKDGNRIILGGLINTKNIINSNKVPILGDIPVISYLFKYEEKIKQVQELVIIIEPHIIHKSKNTVSLSDLGYEGMTDDILMKERLLNTDQTDALTVDNAPKVGLKVPQKLIDAK
jgi:general secretion pathway protein D